MKISKNSLLLLIIFLLVSYIVYEKVTAKERITSAPSGTTDVLKVRTFDIPETLAFAGEAVPLNDIEVRERLDRELHVNAYWHSSTISSMKRAARWLPQIAEVLKENDLPEDYKYLAVIESGLMNVKSPRGATGYWQIMEATGKELGLEINEEVDERYDPLKSTEAASDYLKRAYQHFGSYTAAAASYNMGIVGLQVRMNEQEVSSYYDLLLNPETSRYIFRALALKEIMENPEKYGYEIPQKHLYQEEPVEYVQVDSTLEDLVDFATKHDINYKILKQYNPWLRKNTLTIKEPGKVYTIKIPKNPPAYHHEIGDSLKSVEDSSEWASDDE